MCFVFLHSRNQKMLKLEVHSVLNTVVEETDGKHF